MIFGIVCVSRALSLFFFLSAEADCYLLLLSNISNQQGHDVMNCLE